jgi:hypothetical protein
MLLDDLVLPRFEDDRTSVFHSRPVLREQACPMFRVARYGDTPGPLHDAHRGRGERLADSLDDIVDDSGPGVRAEDPQPVGAQGLRNVPVTQIHTEEVGIAFTVQRSVGATRTRGGVLSRLARPPGAPTPMMDSALREIHASGDVLNAQSGCVQPSGFGNRFWWMHGRTVASPTDNYECPRWDSNPHCMHFECIISADWITGAYPFRINSDSAPAS